MGAKMVYGIGIMLSGVFTLMGPVAVRAKFYAFIAIRVLTGASSVWPNVQEVDMSRNKNGEWKNMDQHDSGVGLTSTLSRCCIPPSDLHLLFVQTQTHFEFTFAEKRALVYLYRIYCPSGRSTPISRRWVRGKSKTELNVRRPLRCKRDFCSSGMLHSVDW